MIAFRISKGASARWMLVLAMLALPFVAPANGDPAVDPRLTDDLWTSMGISAYFIDYTGPNVLHYDHDGELYVGGSFISIGGGFALGVARWNGTWWEPIGASIRAEYDITGYPPWPYPEVNGLAFDMDGGFYAGGRFNSLGDGSVSTENIAYWNGEAWEPLGSGVSSKVYDIALNSEGDLIVVGDFTHAGDIEVNGIARWDGNEWHAFGGGATRGNAGFRGLVCSIAIASDDSFYITGNFHAIDGNVAQGVARWSNGEWSNLGDPLFYQGDHSELNIGPDGTVYLSNSGFWDFVQWTHGVHIWDGESWELLEIDGVTDPILQVGFTNSGRHFALIGVAGSHLRVTTIEWNDLRELVTLLDASELQYTDSTPEFRPRRFALNAPDTPALHTAIDHPNGFRFSGIQVLGEDGWHLLSEAPYEAVNDLIVDEKNILYAAGAIWRVGDTHSHQLASWNGERWSPVQFSPPAVGYTAAESRSLVVNDPDDVVLVGKNLPVASDSLTNFARWNGEEFLGTSQFEDVDLTRIVRDGGGIYYVGAQSLGLGQVQPDPVYRSVDLANWEVLGEGEMSAIVRDIVSNPSGELYVSGGIYLSGSDDFYQVAHWDGITWSALPNTPFSSVDALLLADDGSLYAGSYSTFTLGISVARWDGQIWTVLGEPDGMRRGIASLAMDNEGNLYAGGTTQPFAITPPIHAYLARWDGVQWSGLGSRLSSYDIGWVEVRALAFDNNGDLYVGGNFTIAGNTASSHVAKYRISEITTGGLSITGGDFGDYEWSIAGTNEWIPRGGVVYDIEPGEIEVEFRLDTRATFAPENIIVDVSRNRTTIYNFDELPDSGSMWIFY